MGRRALKTKKTTKRKEEETAELQTKNNLKMIDFLLMVFLVVCLVGFLVDGFCIDCVVVFVFDGFSSDSLDFRSFFVSFS